MLLRRHLVNMLLAAFDITIVAEALLTQGCRSIPILV